MSRTAFFQKIGAEFANSRWSWCAVNHKKREVYFGIWDIHSTPVSGTILSEDWEAPRGRKQPGFSDAKKKISFVEKDGYDLIVFSMTQGQEDRFKAPSKIKKIDEKLMSARLEKVGIEWKAILVEGFDEPAEALTEETVSLFPEGYRKQIHINAYERNSSARRACIEHHKAICKACGFNFERVYGTLGLGFIHVHHKKPIAEIGKSYLIDPIEDLVPLCPNCHAMVHRTNPPVSVEDLKKIIDKARTQ